MSLGGNDSTTKAPAKPGLSIRLMCEIALLTALIGITGAFKLPNVIPGVDFQLSAPIAVAICAVFGFKRYIIAGCLASLISLLLGTQNLLNVAIAMQFRILVGLILYVAQNRLWAICIAGPIASIVARLTLYIVFGKLSFAMIAAAVPGYIFTALCAPLFVKVFKRLHPVVPSIAKTTA